MYHHLPGLVKFLLIAIICAAQFKSYAQGLASTQEMPGSLAMRQEEAETKTLKSVLNAFETKYKVFFHYESDLIGDKKLSNTPLKAESDLDYSLNTILTPFKLTFKKLNNNYYLIYEASEKNRTIRKIEQKLNLDNSSSSLENEAGFAGMNSSIERLTQAMIMLKQKVIAVTGKVSSETGDGLPGVNILLKGTTTGTTTDAEGKYTISIPDASANGTLVFSFIGYTTEEVAINSRTEVNISLLPDIKALSEIVVIGYGEQKRSDITGAVASVKADEIKNLPVRSVAEALQGRVAGVVITQDDGNPRAGADVVIRGPVNINGRGPLYVVDGIPFIGTGSAFNIQDVESIEVLKDASAAAIYGTLGSGGVILVTTKKGKAGKLKVTGNANYGIRRVFNLPKFLRRDDYIRAKTAFGFDAQNLFGDPSNYAGLPDTDWFDEIYDTGKEQNYTLALSGGSEKSTFYTSVNYNRIDGPKILNWNERFAVRFNSDHSLNKRLKVGQTLYASTMNEDPSSSSTIPFRNTPIMPVYDATNPVGGWGISPPGFNGGNPVGDETIQYRNNKDYEFNLGAYWEVSIIEGLKFRNNLAFGQYGREEYNYNFPYSFGIVSDYNENFGKYMRRDRNYLANFIVSYTKTWGQHSLSAMIGYEARKAEGTDVGGSNRKPFVTVPQNFGLVTSDIDARPRGGSWQGDRYLSQFGRITYAFQSKYLLTANIRRDGSALKFGPKNKFGVFPSLALGWKISEEGFMQSIPFISSLKLRGSYGVLGNEPGDNYLFSTGYVIGGNDGYIYDFGNNVRQIGVTGEARLPNPDIKWESVATTNFGLDGGLFGNTFTFSIDVYNRQTKDMIYRVNLPKSAGVGGEVQKNVGEMNNKGLEVVLDYRNKLGDFSYGITLTGSYNKNKLITLIPELKKLELRDGNSNQAYGDTKISKSEPGQPLGQFFGYIVDGIYADDTDREARPIIAASGDYKPQAGDLIYRDINSDGKINDDDKAYIGNPWPKLNYGLNLNLGYKGFDLSLFFNGVQGADIYNAASVYANTFYGDYNTTSDIFGASFFNGNGLTDQPRIGDALNQDKNGNHTFVSSYHVENGSFLKLKNLQFGYSLPQSLLSKTGIGSARIFFMANNLFTLTKYTGMNPELGGRGPDSGRPEVGSVRAMGVNSDWNRYPPARLFSLGLNLEF